MPVQLKGATLPSVKINDLGITVAWDQVITITNQQYASSKDSQSLVKRRLLTKLTGAPVTPTTVNASDVDPQTFNVRPGKLNEEDMAPEVVAILQRVPLTYTILDRAPTVDDDETEGHGPFSEWIDSDAEDHYVCLDASEGAAVWKKTTP